MPSPAAHVFLFPWFCKHGALTPSVLLPYNMPQLQLPTKPDPTVLQSPDLATAGQRGRGRGRERGPGSRRLPTAPAGTCFHAKREGTFGWMGRWAPRVKNIQPLLA